MACFKNESKGARAILLRGGSYLLVEVGQTVTVDGHRIVSMAEGLVEVDPPSTGKSLPEPPASLKVQLDHDGNGKAGGSKPAPQSDDLKALRAEYRAKVGKNPFPGWGADELRRRMGDA